MNIENSVSVIVPCFNCSKTIEETVWSILNQDYSNLEIILVDDGSTDGTLDLLKKVFEKNEKVKIFCQGNFGVSRARNYGVSVSSGRLITFLDSDDLFLEGKLSKQIEYLNINKLDVVFANIIRFEDIFEKRNWHSTTKPADSSGNNYLYSVATMDLFSYANFSTGIFRRDVLASNQWNEKLKTGEDWELWARIASGNYKVGNFESTTNCYRKHENNTTKKHVELMTLKSHVSIIHNMKIDDELKIRLIKEKIIYYSNIMKNRSGVTFSQCLLFATFSVKNYRSISVPGVKNVIFTFLGLKI